MLQQPATKYKKCVKRGKQYVRKDLEKTFEKVGERNEKTKQMKIGGR
jgi:hypothetical protein